MRSLKTNFRNILHLAIPIAGLASGSSAWAGVTEQVLYNFCSNHGIPLCSDGAGPIAGLFLDNDGNLYGTALNGGGNGHGGAFRLMKPASPTGAWTYDLLHSFTGYPSDGDSPRAALVGDVSNGKGELFGTTYAGGTGHTGTVFKISSSTSGVAHFVERTLHSFLNSEGAFPSARLAEDQLGYYLYGTTLNGGLYTKGTVFKVAESTNTLTAVHQFGGVVAGRRDGANPFAGVALGLTGNFFGTTNIGGGAINGPGVGLGVVYEITSDGKYHVIHEFGGLDSRGISDGANPQADLVVDVDGNLYGTTLNGGKYNRGTVFELSKVASGTWVSTVLHSFTAGPDGAGPEAGVIRDRAGNLFGTAQGTGGGVAFKLSPPGSLGCPHPVPPDPWCKTTIWTFPGRPNDGLYPHSLIADGAGNLYGTTFGGGRWGEGVVFMLTGTGFVP